MGRYKQALLAAGLIFISTETFAAPPIMDGTFIIESSTSCQYEITASTAPNPDRVTLVFGSFKGQFEKAIFRLTFNDATKKVSGKGLLVTGDEIAVANQSFQGVMEETITITNQPFSNTATTFKIGPDVFKVFYGNVVAGKLKNAVFVRRLGRCAESGTVMQVEN